MPRPTDPADRRPRRGRDDWAWRRVVRARRGAHLAYRALVALVGLLVVAVGLVLVPLAGPGWLIVIGGVAIWATEFEWAQGLKTWGLARLTEWTAWVGRQSLAVRGALAGATGLVVLAVTAVTVSFTGTPEWLPDVVEQPVDDVCRRLLPAR